MSQWRRDSARQRKTAQPRTAKVSEESIPFSRLVITRLRVIQEEANYVKGIAVRPHEVARRTTRLTWDSTTDSAISAPRRFTRVILIESRVNFRTGARVEVGATGSPSLPVD